MSDVTELRGWPSCPNVVDWSHDGIIAISLEESVKLLFPDTEVYDTEHGNRSWQHVSLQVPWFTIDELPYKEPAPFPSYSIGEEISLSDSVHLSWSLPGLARDRRCALGALTSNLVLSVWSADGKPERSSSWGRRLIINDSLKEYFNSKAAHEESILASEPEEKLRFRSRIRAFAWAQALPETTSCGIVGTQLQWDNFMVVMANDDNHIVFATIYSTTSTCGIEEDWTAHIMTHFSIGLQSGDELNGAMTFDDLVKQQRHVSHLAWSPWIVRKDCYQSVLVYATNENVRARIITYSNKTIRFGDEIVYSNLNLRYGGLLKWSPHVLDREKLKLAAFSNSGLTCLSISAADAAILSRASHDLNGRWDGVSGAVWDHTQATQTGLHFSHLNSTPSPSTTLLAVTDDELIALPSPNWREQIHDSQALFSARNELKGHALSKVWGLAASPLGDFIVTLHTVHPSDMIEYGSVAVRRSTIAIHGLRPYNREDLGFPARATSAESLLFTLRKWKDNTVEDTDQIAEFVDDMLGKMMKKHAAGDVPVASMKATSPYGHGDFSKYLQKLKRAAFVDTDMVKDRYTILLSQVCDPQAQKHLEKTLIAYRLANAVQALPFDLSTAASFSSEILLAHKQVIRLINSLTNETEATLDSAAPTTGSLVSTSGLDACDFCLAPIPFNDLNTGACFNGHQFSRCGLSFLTIQAAGITKYCSICNTPFLSEEFVSAQETSAGEASKKSDAVVREELVSTEPETRGHAGQDSGDGTAEQQRESGTAEKREERSLPTSLARVLFLSCDVCIYCGGKFYK